MPLPKPNTGEKQKDFVSRCISELHDMGEFEDNKQRIAVCYSQWERKTKSEQVEYDMIEKTDTTDELSEAPIKRVSRVRGGKVQRRKKVADKAGYKTKGGKAVRMKASERLARKRGAVKAAKKRKGKKSQIARKTKKSMRLRKARGL